MGSWVWCKAPLEHLLLSSNPAVDTSHASLLSHPHSPPSWLMISLSFDVLMKSLSLSWMAGPLLANYSIKCKWKGNVTRVICLVNMSHQAFSLFFNPNNAGWLSGKCCPFAACIIHSGHFKMSEMYLMKVDGVQSTYFYNGWSVFLYKAV